MSDLDMVMDALDARSLFGTNEKRAKIIYRRLMRSVHPDMVDSTATARANAAFARLNTLWDQWSAAHSTNGSQANTAPPPTSDVISTALHDYHVVGKVSGDPFFSRTEVTYAQGKETASVLIVAHPSNSDLAQHHADTLTYLHQSAPAEFLGFYPQVIETFEHRDGSATRLGIVQTRTAGFVPFSKILSVYPDGIDGRDVAWIFRRMLVAVGNAHDVGRIHGAVSMDSFSIHPEEHGVILSDWQYSVESGQSLRAVPQGLKDKYPDSVLSKGTVTANLDINFCGKIASELLDQNGPQKMRDFFNVCQRQQSLPASVLLAEFDRLLYGLYGEPRFHPFTLNGATS